MFYRLTAESTMSLRLAKLYSITLILIHSRTLSLLSLLFWLRGLAPPGHASVLPSGDAYTYLQ